MMLRLIVQSYLVVLTSKQYVNSGRKFQPDWKGEKRYIVENGKK
jgi:hypothetical protein